MIKFAQKSKGEMPKISTASLPDVIFMLLFFFMVSSTIKNTSIKVNIRSPFATELKKLEKKSLVLFVYVGKPKDVEKYGTAPRIQINDAFVSIDKVGEVLARERENKPENDKPKMSVSIKADINVEMGIITDIKQELRKVSLLKVNYSAQGGTVDRVFENLR